jgi:hypothetical protein
MPSNSVRLALMAQEGNHLGTLVRRSELERNLIRRWDDPFALARRGLRSQTPFTPRVLSI